MTIDRLLDVNQNTWMEATCQHNHLRMNNLLSEEGLERREETAGGGEGLALHNLCLTPPF